MSWLRTACVKAFQIVQYTFASIGRRYAKPGTSSIDILAKILMGRLVKDFHYESNLSIIRDFQLSELQKQYLDSIERLCFSKAFPLMIFCFARAKIS
jgi:hypothetical protein